MYLNISPHLRAAFRPLRYSFYTARAELLQQIYGRQTYRSPMNSMILRARQMSLALLVIAVVDHGHLQADYSGATPGSSGLMRLGRDLMRRAGGEITAEIAASDRASSRNRRTRPATA
jgi:hypothetical protein